VTRVVLADEDDSCRDALTGASLGDPAVAVRVGIAVAVALVVARVVNIAVGGAMRGRAIAEWMTEWQIAFAVALPLGAALTVMAWRDRPGRPLVLRASEAALLALLVHVATDTWAIFNLQTTFSKDSWWWLLTADFECRLPKIAGQALGLLFAARQRGRHAVGVAQVIPMELGESAAQVVWWPQFFSVTHSLIHSAAIMVVAPLAERAVQQLVTSIRRKES
jgi:hypothetical protein